jgi:hypothetical protein
MLAFSDPGGLERKPKNPPVFSDWLAALNRASPTATGMPSLRGTTSYLLHQHIVATNEHINRMTPNATPTPILAFAPDERSLEIIR